MSSISYAASFSFPILKQRTKGGEIEGEKVGRLGRLWRREGEREGGEIWREKKKREGGLGEREEGRLGRKTFRGR